MSNTCETFPEVWDNHGKLWLIPNIFFPPHGGLKKAPALQEGLAAYQLVGEVMAHQGIDG